MMLYDRPRGTICILGDSRTNEIFDYLGSEKLLSNYTLVNQSVVGITAAEASKDIEALSKRWEASNRVYVSLGVNDARKDTKAKIFIRHIKKIIAACEKADCLPVISSVLPVSNGDTAVNKLISEYNDALYDLCRSEGCRYIDVYQLLNNLNEKDKFSFRDGLHFKHKTNKVLSKHLARILEREHVTILWQYNGYSAKCNYRCHYCYYIGLHHPEDINPVSFEKWEAAFKKHFRLQKIVFYCAHGEPTFGEGFDKICDMVVNNPLWRLRITSNIDTDFIKSSEHKIFESQRFHINASFHKMHVKKEKFLELLLKLRDRGIEAPIVYVAHPKYYSEWASDVKYFEEHNFLVHFRRFQGRYDNKLYPWAYTREELNTFIGLTDLGSVQYMLNGRRNTGDVTFSGYDFFIVDNAGNMGYDSNAFEERSLNRSRLGNILVGSFRPDKCPSPYPGKYASTVDETANIYSNGYRQLIDNNLFAFMEQGNVYKAGNRLNYGNLELDLRKGRVRDELNLYPDNVETHIRFWMGSRPVREKILSTTQQLRTFAKENKHIYRAYKSIVK